MTRHSLRSNQDGFSKVAGASMFRVNQLEQQFIAGDILWIKLKTCSWWPTQVVDENSICVKPKKKLKDDILVRLYGSYEYQYVNPHKCNMEFENVLRQQNISKKEILQNALEMDLAQLKSDCKSRKRVSDTTGNTSPKALSSKRLCKESTPELPSVVLSSSPGSSSVPKRRGKKKKEMEASDAPEANQEVEPDEAKELSEANSVVADFTKEDDTNPGAHKMHNESEGTKRRSRVKNQRTLRRSPRSKVKEQLANPSENGKVEMKHGEEEQLKEKVTGDFFNRKTIQKNEVRSPVSGPSRLTKQSFLRKQFHEDAEEEEAREVTSDQSKVRKKRHLESGIPHSVERAVNGDSAFKKWKQSGLTEAEIRDAELARQVVINELLKHNLIKLGEPQRHDATAETPNGYSTSKSTEQNGLHSRENKKLLEHQNSQTSTSLHMPDANGDSSTRKTRVMQSLGLIAPSGSPFHKNGKVKSQV